MLERIRTLLTARQLSPTQFADTIGVSRPIVSHILSGRNKPSLEVVQKIVGAFPDLSLRWLLNGEGRMVATEAPQPATEPPRARPTAAKTTPPTPESQEAATKPAAAPEAAVAAPITAEAGSAFSTAPADPLPASYVAVTDAAASAAYNPIIANAFEPNSQKVTGGVDSAVVAEPSIGAELARGLAEPGKRIRRIVIFYQDGTFTDYQPDTAG